MTILFTGASQAATAAPQDPPAATAAPNPRSLGASCISLSQVRRTVIVDDQTILFYLSGGRIRKVTLAFPCPSLKFYGSFGYEVYANRLCARVDTIVSRAGTHCPIRDISDVTP